MNSNKVIQLVASLKSLPLNQTLHEMPTEYIFTKQGALFSEVMNGELPDY